jgi:2-oxoisovalerate dehydrogenase E2 component (dihydrolipoyl transacylase)
MATVCLPELGEGITKATVACWHFQQGDSLRAGDEVVEVVTDKAVFSVPAEDPGVLTRIFVAQGEDAAVGGKLFEVGPPVEV